MNLTIQQHELSNQYFELLDTIKEAFEYVLASFSEYEKTEGERVLADIFAAFVQVEESKEILIKVFQSKNKLNYFRCYPLSF